MIFDYNANSYLNVRTFICYKLNQMEKQFLARLVKTQYILTTDKDNRGIGLIEKSMLQPTPSSLFEGSFFINVSRGGLRFFGPQG